MKATFLAILLISSSLLAGDKDLKLAAAQKIAVAVEVPTSVNDIQWLFDLWECVDRLIVKPPKPPVIGDRFIYIDSIDFRDSEPHFPSGYSKNNDGVVLWAQCKAHEIPAKPFSFSDYVNIYKPGFTFGAVEADFFTFKRDPAKPPAWFYLENQLTGDRYLFRRVKTTDK